MLYLYSHSHGKNGKLSDTNRIRQGSYEAQSTGQRTDDPVPTSLQLLRSITNSAPHPFSFTVPVRMTDGRAAKYNSS